jgi:transcriptional regulator with XRE-family HTH domain
VRIAKRLGVDPSYVSRVARGQRYSAIVEEALRQELDQINAKLARTALMVSAAAPASRRSPTARLRFFVKRDRGWIRREWLRTCRADPLLRRLPLSLQKRVSPILPLVKEAMRRSQFTHKALLTTSSRVAEAHGRLRRKQGYSVTALVEEYNLVRRCISRVAEKHLDQLESRVLLHDLSQVGAAIDRQVQGALDNFLDHA